MGPSSHEWDQTMMSGGEGWLSGQHGRAGSDQRAYMERNSSSQSPPEPSVLL
jgi:hypothetical protein